MKIGPVAWKNAITHTLIKSVNQRPSFAPKLKGEIVPSASKRIRCNWASPIHTIMSKPKEVGIISMKVLTKAKRP